MLRVCPPVLRGFNPPVGGGRDDPSKRKNVAPGRAHEKGISQKQIQQVAENLQSGLLKRMRENANRKNARPMTTAGRHEVRSDDLTDSGARAMLSGGLPGGARAGSMMNWLHRRPVRRSLHLQE